MEPIIKSKEQKLTYKKPVSLQKKVKETIEIPIEVAENFKFISEFLEKNNK